MLCKLQSNQNQIEISRRSQRRLRNTIDLKDEETNADSGLAVAGAEVAGEGVAGGEGGEFGVPLGRVRSRPPFQVFFCQILLPVLVRHCCNFRVGIGLDL